MTLFTHDGRFVFDGMNIANDGTRVRSGTMFLEDGTRLYHLIDHTIPTYALTSNLNSKAIQNERVSFTLNLECINNADRGNELKVSLIIPSGFTLVSAISNQGTYNISTGLWTLYLDDQEAELNVVLEAESTGTQTITATLQSPYESSDFVCDVSASDTASIAYHDADLADYPVTLANLQDGKHYTVISYSKVTEASIHEGIKNNRLSVVNGVETFGSRATVINTIEKQIVTFVYDETQPLLIRRYEQYESVDPTTDNEWLGLCINEGYNTVYSESTNLLSLPEAMFDDTGACDLLLPGNSESAEYVFEFEPVSTLSNQFFTGIAMGLNNFKAVASGIQVQLKTDDFESEIKSTFLPPFKRMEMGDIGDDWGLNLEYLQNKSLFAHIKIRNTTLNPQIFQYNNLILDVYSDTDKTGGAHSVIYNSKHGRIYGLSIDADRNHEGPQFNLETLSMAFMDGELPIRFNITSKELEIDFVITGNTLEEAQTRLRAISRWFKNDRTLMSRPVYNSLIFTYDLTKEYFVIFKDVIEVEKEITSLKCTAKFYVPEGVARSIEPVVSGPIGSNVGEIRVWPVIEVKTDGSSQLVVRDTVTGNTITLNDSPGENTTLYIDCEKRTITDDAGNEYQTNLALNSVWINFLDEYSITTTGGVFQQLSYRPGY